MTTAQRNKLRDQYAAYVRAGVESDCEAHADYVDTVVDQLVGQKNAGLLLKGAISTLAPNQFFQLGFTYGGDVATSAAPWFEKLEGTPGNTGDINLGEVAGRLGSYVASWSIAAENQRCAT